VTIVRDEMICDETKERKRKYNTAKKKGFCCKVERENEGRKVEQRIHMTRKKQQVRQKGDRKGKQRRLMTTERCRKKTPIRNTTRSRSSFVSAADDPLKRSCAGPVDSAETRER